MDGGTFDRLTRLLAGRLSRRAGLAGLAGAFAAGPPMPGLAARRRSQPDHHRQPAADHRDSEVIDEKKPCGPKPSDNRCRNHKDCCTKYCRKPKGKAKIGRCRCVKPNKKCKNGQKCCGGALCQNRKCTIQPTCPGAGAACTGDAGCCTGLVCQAGVCAACTATVCASGCAFTTVNAAYAAAAAGSTIYIGPGEYPVGITVTKDITLAACPGVTGVTLKPDDVLQNPGDSYSVMIAESETDTATKHTVTLRNLAMVGSAANDETLLFSKVNGTVSFVVEDCTVDGANVFIWAGVGNHVLERVAISDAIAGVVLMPDPSITEVVNLTVDGSTFTDGRGVQGPIPPFFIAEDATNGNTTITNTTVSNSQGGFNIYLDGKATITMTDVTVTQSMMGYMFGLQMDPAKRSDTTATLTRIKSTKNGAGSQFQGGVFQVSASEFSQTGPSQVPYQTLTCTNITFTDTQITGGANNDSTAVGAGLFAIGAANCGSNVNVTLAGSTSVTGNTATKSPGLTVQVVVDGSYTITGASGRIQGNTGTPECTKCVGVSCTSASDFNSNSCSAP